MRRVVIGIGVAALALTSCLTATPGAKQDVDAVPEQTDEGEAGNDIDVSPDMTSDLPDDLGDGDQGLDVLPDTDACKPVCGGAECGDDRCGGSCGTCTGGKVCQTGVCVCAAESYRACCDNAVCWFDSCGTQGTKVVDCPKGCQGATCLDCTADCTGKQCGEDGCGYECGQCASGNCGGLMWTTPAGCVSGHCSGGGATQACDDGNPCTQDTCDPKLGCGHRIFEDATECLSGNCNILAWTKPKTCVSGQCTGGGDIESCDDANPCTDDACFSGAGCVHTPNTKSCDDGDPCTTVDNCSGSKCIGMGVKECYDGDPCTDDSCEKGIGCLNIGTGEDCDDSDLCTTGDTCRDDGCHGDSICGEPNPNCTEGTCYCGTSQQLVGKTLVCDPERSKTCEPMIECPPPMKCPWDYVCKCGNEGQCDEGKKCKALWSRFPDPPTYYCGSL
jgi:hypothetical protein